MAKEKKVETRDLVYSALASAIIQDNGKMDTIRRHKEGLELDFNGETFVIRAVKKKEALDEKEFRGEYFHDVAANAFGYREFSK